MLPWGRTFSLDHPMCGESEWICGDNSMCTWLWADTTKEVLKGTPSKDASWPKIKDVLLLPFAGFMWLWSWLCWPSILLEPIRENELWHVTHYWTLICSHFNSQSHCGLTLAERVVGAHELISTQKKNLKKKKKKKHTKKTADGECLHRKSLYARKKPPPP